MAEDQKPGGFKEAEKTAADFVKDKAKTEHLLIEAVQKADREKSFLGKIWDDLQALFRLVRAWHKGEYTEVPMKTIMLAISAVVYFVNPFDLVPDFLPGVGFIDDAAVIGFVLRSIKEDIDRFLAWEGTRGRA
ncbi:MAG: YkvA family protein [Nitrospiria bacterium]